MSAKDFPIRDAITELLTEARSRARRPPRPGERRPIRLLRSLHLSPEVLGLFRSELKIAGQWAPPAEAYPDWMLLSFGNPPFLFDGVWIVADPTLYEGGYLIEMEGLLSLDKTHE